MVLDVRIAAFVVVTLGLMYVSRASLLRPRSHGFFRFLAWEAILGLFLVNAPAWFRGWRSWNQVISWILLFVSFVPLASGVRALRLHGQAEAQARQDPTLFPFERTSSLVTDGVFHYVRHPMYCSLLLLAWGIFFKGLSGASASLVATTTLSLLLAARADESECVAAFGTEYQSYMRRTKMFIPYVL